VDSLLFTVTSEHIRFYFLFFTLFSCRFRAVDYVDSCRLGFRAHVKIASRFVSYRIVDKGEGGGVVGRLLPIFGFHNLYTCIPGI